ncbi:TIGR02099 family protein [Colwellia sp. 75C3]|uniref:YhdP family protein n=1 Tax=Colwellia sp. 75C3 TaxID=888425 RepID=UPI000C3318D1|nr:YhdP family protein [Colwellia sp. 75C3]PKG85270.1 TIGR02099 family protein [Colwellia sp. 75C3]
MSIVSTSNRWLNRLYKTVAILLVLLAVLISAFRLFLPYVHHYRLPLQNYLNEKIQANISIGTLSMTWQRSGPILIIGDVQILKTKSASLFIKQLELQVDFWSTISQQELISKNLILSGATANVSEKLWLGKKDSDDTTQVEKDNEADDISTISDLFLNRITRFSIRDSQITVSNQSITRSIRLNQLRWLNSGDRHQAEGSVVLNGLSSNNLQLKLDLQGNKGSALTGQMYLQANQIDITPWLDNVLVLEDDKTSTDINFSAWLRINSSEVDRLQVNFSDSSMHWQVADNKQQLTLDQGQLLLVKGKTERSFKLYSTPLSLQFNDQESQKFSAMLAKQGDDFSLHLSEIDVAMLAQLTPLIVAKQETRNLLSEMTLNGKIEDLYIRNQNNELQILTNFSAFNNSYSYGIPGLENVSGSLSYVNNYLSVDFSAKQGNLDFDKLFVQAFPYQSLSGKLNAVFDDKGWELTVETIDLLSEEINLSAIVNVEAPIDGEVNLALLANVTNGNAGLVGRYLPLPIMSDNLVSYLNAAVVSGRVEEAQILINGPINRFPFTDGSGIFVVDAELSQSEFKFVENWPAITDFVANLNFTNNSMLITGRGGKLTGLDVTGVRAGIADLAHGQILTVDAGIKPTQARYIGDLMNQSPFKDSVGSVLEQLKINGEVSGDFHLNLPLNNNEQALASGTIKFDNNQVALQTPKMDFSEVHGELSFSNDKISTKDLTLNWQGLPISLDISGMDKDDYYDTDIKLAALWPESAWLAHMPQKLKRYTQGELPWQGTLSLHQHHQGGFSYNASFDSDLTNTQLLLPAPYDRNIEQENHLSLQVNGEQAQSKIVLNYGDKMHFSGLLDHKSTAFTRANLMFGEGTMALPSDGFHITTKLEQADISEWQPLISDIIDSINQPSSYAPAGKQASTNNVEQEISVPFLAKPKRIRGSINELKILGQQLTNVSFNLLDKEQWWLLQLNAKETRSQIKIYPDWLEQGLDINAEFLKLPQNKEEQEVSSALAVQQPDKNENDIVFANIPPLTFHCDSCAIGLLDLGEVDVQVKRVDHQIIEFTDFSAKRDKTQLTLTGQWLHNTQESKTTLQGKLSIDDIETELQAMGYESIIKDSGAKIDVDLNWAGGLHNLTVSQLNGRVNGRLDDGYLADVSDKAKILSVLSLQSLVRKLTLDFRDIFSDGMFYSSIEGDYQLKQGLLTTDNTEMNGTAGNLFMTGYTNLVTGKLNYDMSYKPELTSSLPVLAWIATLNPVTFLAGVAIDQVIKSQVVSEFTFELTGTIEKPEFEEVDRKSKDIIVESTMPTEDVRQEESIEKDIPAKNSASKSD